MALTNPNRLINLQELDYFEGKISGKYATKQELQEAQVGSMFHIYVDKATMHLKGTPTSEGTFQVRNGHLILSQTSNQ